MHMPAGNDVTERHQTPVMPGAWPLVGHAPAFLRDKPAFLLACQRACGDVVRLELGGPTLLLNNPFDVKHVLVDAAALYEKTDKLTSDSGRQLSGNGLHTATGSRHVQLRRMVQPLFHRQMVTVHEVAATTEAEKWSAGRRDGDRVELWQEMLSLSQRIMLRALFGPSDIEAEQKFAAAVTARRRYIEYFFTSNVPFAPRWPLPVVHDYKQARHTLHRVLQREIDARKAAVPTHDWLSMLVHAEGRDGERFTSAQIIDEAITLTSTGYETVAAMLTWTLHLLAHHPVIQEQLRGTLSDTVPAGQDASLLEKVLDESMRLYPPTWLYLRRAVAADALPSGHDVQPGDKIYLSPFTMHRQSRWYADPLRFDPSRFEPSAVQGRPRFAFFPFGGGARQCIGEPFARMEARVVLTQLLRALAIEPLTRRDVPLRPSIVLEPRGGLPMLIRTMTAAPRPSPER